jgi:hypothetical protein
VPDAALAKKLCEDSRKDASPEIRNLCAPAECIAIHSLLLYERPWIAFRENGRLVYVPLGTRVMAWAPGPHEFTPDDRDRYLWIEWQGRAKLASRASLIPFPFKVEQALVIHPYAAILSEGETGQLQKRPGLGTIISVTRPPEHRVRSHVNTLFVIENGNPVGTISESVVKMGVSALPAPVKRYALLPAVVVRDLPELKSPATKTVSYGSVLEVYTGPPEILHDGFLPVVKAEKNAGYVPASEVSERVPSAEDFMTAIRNQVEAVQFKLAAGICTAAAESYPGYSDFEALKKELDKEQALFGGPPTCSGAIPTITLGKFVDLQMVPSAPVVMTDAESLKKSFQNQFATKQYKEAFTTIRELDRLARNGMQPFRTAAALYYDCRGDIIRARDITLAAYASVPEGTDWCIAEIDLDGPCGPCTHPPMGFEPDENTPAEEVEAADKEIAAEHYKIHVVPVQKEVERYETWKKKFKQALPPSPKLRLRLENIMNNATPSQTAFLYHFTYHYPVENDQFSLGEGVRGPVMTRAITIPALEPGGSVIFLVDVPAFENSVYGVVFAHDALAAIARVKASPLPEPRIDGYFGPSVPRKRVTGIAIPGEISKPPRACICWRQ